MTLKKVISNTKTMQGNLYRGTEAYILGANMRCFAEKLSDVDARQGILITPYLIADDGGLYELHYCEFDVEVRGDKSYYVDYNPGNVLPKEITENLKPQAIIAVGDKKSYTKAVKEYLENMSKMEFSEEKESHPTLKNAQLFFQIFIGERRRLPHSIPQETTRI